MPRQPNPPAGDRIFARVDRFDCECPGCGQVIRGTLSARAQGPAAESTALETITKRGRLAGRGNSATAYNPVTSTLRCPYCYAVYQVGLILWPVGIGRQRQLIPEDQRPTQAQLRRLRSFATGFVAQERKRRGDPVNVYVTAECTCPAPAGWRPSCPIHGWEATKARMAEADAPDNPDAAGSAPAGEEIPSAATADTRDDDD